MFHMLLMDVKKLKFIGFDYDITYHLKMVNNHFFKYLENEEHLWYFEKFLNVFGMDYQLEIRQNLNNLDLYITNRKNVLFYHYVSAQTLFLMDLYRRFIFLFPMNDIIFLNCDHQLDKKTMETVIRYFADSYPSCQIINITNVPEYC